MEKSLGADEFEKWKKMTRIFIRRLNFSSFVAYYLRSKG